MKAARLVDKVLLTEVLGERPATEQRTAKERRSCAVDRAELELCGGLQKGRGQRNG